jgi:hypothetical protein
MSDAISQNSAKSAQNSSTRFDEGFDGRAEIITAWSRGLAPDPALTVSAWADRYRFLSSRASSEAGRYRTDRTPYMRGVMDALSPGSSARQIVFMKAAQVGATEAGNNWIGYCIHQAPGPFLGVQPTTDLAKRLSQQRIEPLIDESPELRALILPSRSQSSLRRLRKLVCDSGNTGSSAQQIRRRAARADRRQFRCRPAVDARTLRLPRRGGCL